MVRVANLHDQLEAGVDARGADGMSPRTRSTRSTSASRSAGAAGAMLRARASPGARRARDQDHLARARERGGARQLDRAFEKSIFPALTPLAIGLGRPFPYISNLSLSLAVTLRDPDQGTEVIARVKVPKELLGRFVAIGGAADDAGPARGPDRREPESLFPGWRSRTTPSSGSRATPTTTSPTRRTICSQAVEEELRRRRFGEVVRLEVDRDEPAAARAAPRRAEDRPAPAVRGRRAARHVRPLGRGRGGRLQRAARPAHTPVTQPRLRGEDGDGGGRLRRDPRKRTSWSTIRTTRSRARSSASSSRPWRTRTCWRSSRPSTGRAPTRRWFRP